MVSPLVTRCVLCGDLVALGLRGRRRVALTIPALTPHVCYGPLKDLPGRPRGSWAALAAAVEPVVREISTGGRP